MTSSTTLEDLVDSTVTIPTIPTTLLEIQAVLADPEGSARDAALVIEKDPAIATKVLRLANSSFYGLSQPVSSVNLACSILGFKVIKNLAVQATVVDTFAAIPAVASFDPTWLWDHSFKTALAARLLCEAAPERFAVEREEAYTCGLIHDVGKMVLVESDPERFRQAFERSSTTGVPLFEAETEVFGFNHADVGGLLAERWRLAADLQLAVLHHHAPPTDRQDRDPGLLVHAANDLAHGVAEPGGWHGDAMTGDRVRQLGITEERLAEIREEVRLAGDNH